MSEQELTLEQILGAGPMARIPSPHALYAKLRRGRRQSSACRVPSTQWTQPTDRAA